MFPPEQHIMRDIGFTGEHLDDGRFVAVTPDTRDLRGRRGLPAIGALGVVADSVATMAVLPLVQPDWVATADLAIHVSGLPVAGRLLLDAVPLRAGSRLVTVRVAVSDCGTSDADTILDRLASATRQRPVGAALGVATLSFVRMPSSRSTASLDAAPSRVRTVRGARPPHAAPIDERIGLGIGDEPGAVTVPLSDYVANSMGAISGGVHVIAAQAAAESAFPTLAATSVEVRFLTAARGRSVETATSIVRDSPDLAVVSVDMRDGSSGGLASTATVLLST